MRVLAEQMPRSGKLGNVDVFDPEDYALFKRYLESRRGEIRAPDLDLAAFVCVTSIESLTHTAVLHHSETCPEEAMQALIDETSRLIVRYLQ